MGGPPADATRVPFLALGILAVPADRASRDSLRATMLRDEAVLSGRAVVRFVIGASRLAVASCLRASKVKAEHLQHGDIAFVNASDCQPWYASHKVHAWYASALRAYPNTPWLGKSEDDALIKLSSLLSLVPLVPSAPRFDYFGADLQWIAHCSVRRRLLSKPRPAKAMSEEFRGFAARSCAQGCWLGRVRGGFSAGACTKAFDGRPLAAGSEDCSEGLHYGAFFPGPFEMRSRRLARAVSGGGCASADTYFASLVERGEAIADECASTDGAQGYAISACLGGAPLVVADMGRRVQAYASLATARSLNRSRLVGKSTGPEVVILHPLKPGQWRDTDAARRDFWRLLDGAPKSRSSARRLSIEWMDPSGRVPLQTPHASVMLMGDGQRLS